MPPAPKEKFSEECKDITKEGLSEGVTLKLRHPGRARVRQVKGEEKWRKSGPVGRKERYEPTGEEGLGVFKEMKVNRQSQRSGKRREESPGCISQITQGLPCRQWPMSWIVDFIPGAGQKDAILNGKLEDKGVPVMKSVPPGVQSRAENEQRLVENNLVTEGVYKGVI